MRYVDIDGIIIPKQSLRTSFQQLGYALVAEVAQGAEQFRLFFSCTRKITLYPISTDVRADSMRVRSTKSRVHFISFVVCHWFVFAGS